LSSKIILRCGAAIQILPPFPLRDPVILISILRSGSGMMSLKNLKGASLYTVGRDAFKRWKKQKRPSPDTERPLNALVPKAGLEPAQADAH
jgi:hypothetical protein